MIFVHERLAAMREILQIEVNLLWPNYELVKFSKRMGMTVTGYCCLGSPGRQAAVLKDDWPGTNVAYLGCLISERTLCDVV